jgi:hypothetical protein
MPDYNAELLVVISAEDYEQAKEAAESVAVVIGEFAAEHNTDGNYGHIGPASVEAIADRRPV